MRTTNTRSCSPARPTATSAPRTSATETVAMPAAKDGEIVGASTFLSLDPYMRPRMSELRS